MADLSIGSTGWSADLVLTAAGDIQTVDGSKLGVQRVIRRLFTNEGALLFHSNYGAGLLGKIGSVIPAGIIQAIVRKQIFQEAVVSQNPPPATKVQEIPEGSGEQVISITYTDRETGGPQLIRFRPGVTAR